MTRKQKRLAVIAGLGVVLALATTLILFALRDQIVFFYSPTEVKTRAVAAGTPIRLGGLVKDGTWVKTGDTNDFVVTDGQTEIHAVYVGILPDPVWFPDDSVLMATMDAYFVGGGAEAGG